MEQILQEEAQEGQEDGDGVHDEDSSQVDDVQPSGTFDGRTVRPAVGQHLPPLPLPCPQKAPLLKLEDSERKVSKQGVKRP